MRIALKMMLLVGCFALLFATVIPASGALSRQAAEARLQQTSPSPTLPDLLSTVIPTFGALPQEVASPLVPSPMALTTLTPESNQTTVLPLAPLKLTGHLVFTDGPQGIRQLDMTSGVFSTLFKPPENGFVVAASVSPDNSVIAMAYEAPPAITTPNAIPKYGYTNIYLLPRNGAGTPKLYLNGDSDDDILILPFWSPDGKYLYHIHYHANQNTYNLERVVYPDTSAETIIKKLLLFASLSPDGSKLTYLEQDPSDSQYNLFVADSSGANPILLVSSSVFYTMDVAIFSPDSQSVVFTASGQPQTYTKPVGPVGVSDWFGKGVALDGNIPSDLWEISLQGGAPHRLTNLNEFSLYPAFSPDGKHIALLAAGGIYLMNADGSNLVRLTSIGTVGTLDWTP